MPDIGLVSVDTDGRWIGGRYYLQHLVKSVAVLPVDERFNICDVYWGNLPKIDPYEEIRHLLSRQVIINFPSGILHRAKRKMLSILNDSKDAKDLFKAAGIDCLFPSTLCASPGIPFVFWLPDFQYKNIPDLFGEKLCKWYEKHFAQNVALANVVILSSKNAHVEFVKTFPEAAQKGRILNFCSVPDNEWWALEPIEVAHKKGLYGKFFIVSNQFSHHKNHEIIFQATKILKDRGVNIIILCTGSTFGFRGGDYFLKLNEYITNNGLENNILIAGMLPRKEQVALMRRAIAMLQPSRFEGWSTVVEDAKTIGKILLASDIPVHKEQLGINYPNYLNVNDAEAWADAMLEIWHEAPPGPHLFSESLGLSNLEKSALTCGHTFIKIIAEAMNK